MMSYLFFHSSEFWFSLVVSLVVLFLESYSLSLTTVSLRHSFVTNLPLPGARPGDLDETQKTIVWT